MYEIAGCRITKAQMKRWRETFVPKQEPFYIANGHELLGQFPAMGLPVYTRAQFVEAEGGFIGEYGAQYHHWGVPDTASVVMLDTSEWTAGQALLHRLYAHQVQLGRGQVYPFDWVEDIGAEWLEVLKESHAVCSDSIILTSDVWHRLPEDIQAAWLLKWLRERVEPMAVPDVETGKLPAQCEAAIRQQAGAFPPSSGANCLSAAAGGYLGSTEMMENWMDVEQFRDVLFREGLVQCDVIMQTTDLVRMRPHDVLVWETVGGDIVHAAYAVTERQWFNEMGQFWFQPWQYVSAEQVMDYAGCLSNGGRIGIYRTQG